MYISVMIIYRNGEYIQKIFFCTYSYNKKIFSSFARVRRTIDINTPIVNDQCMYTQPLVYH